MILAFKSVKLKHDKQNEDILLEPKDKIFEKEDLMSDLKVDTIEQIKNITQAKKNKFETQAELKIEAKTSISSFDDLLKLCAEKKEIKLKYEIEKNVHLVSFEKNRIEISFNDNLDKNFVKDLSLKLFEWTGNRWIITFSKIKGEMTFKEKEQKIKNEILNKGKNSDLYKSVLEKFPDANLVDIVPKEEQGE